MRIVQVGALSLAFFALIAGASIYLMYDDSKTTGSEETDFSTFSSEDDFIERLSGSNDNYRFQNSGFISGDSTAELGGSGSAGVERSSETNIQVSGVDEPDILKNSGENIYYSSDTYYGNLNTSIFSTLPIENFSKTGDIPSSGEMFLTNKSVISLGEDITSYSRDTREEQWSKELNGSIEAARRKGEDLYFVLEERPDPNNPCPVRPMESVVVPCTSVYHPEEGGVDSTFTLIKMNTEGEVLETNSFAGSSSNSIVYMSDDSIYLTYTETFSRMDLFLDFIDEKGDNIFDSDTVESIDEVQSYNLSRLAKRIEIQTVIESYYSSLEEDERSEKRQELENSAGNYTEKRKREIQSTEIAKFDKNLELVSAGSVPGKVDGRYSLDESGDNLRISTTVADSWSFNTETENDLYTLNNDLETMGSVKGMGLNEQIFSTRYIDDKAYIVTFRRVDPFHVIDLSDPQNPELKGELKLPGFSSYLHPLQEDRILGVGEENRTVKAVIFDVEEDDPEVLDSTVLEDYNSEVSQNTRAFQIDRENKVFFLPASDHAYFFNYTEGLEKEAEIEMQNVQRAAYVNQNFYIFNNHEAKAVTIDDWEVEKTVEFAEEQNYAGPLPRPEIVR